MNFVLWCALWTYELRVSDVVKKTQKARLINDKLKLS